jgi:hypothetical protein
MAEADGALLTSGWQMTPMGHVLTDRCPSAFPWSVNILNQYATHRNVTDVIKARLGLDMMLLGVASQPRLDCIWAQLRGQD